MKRIRNLSRLEIVLFFLLIIALLFYFDIRKEYVPMKADVEQCEKKAMELLKLAHKLEKEAIYLRNSQNNLTRSEDYLNNLIEEENEIH